MSGWPVDPLPPREEDRTLRWRVTDETEVRVTPTSDTGDLEAQVLGPLERWIAAMRFRAQQMSDADDAIAEMHERLTAAEDALNQDGAPSQDE